MKIMNRIRKYYNQMSIQHKILYSLYLMFFLAVFVIIGVIYYKDYKAVKNENCALYQRMVDTVKINMEHLQQDARDLGIYFMVNTEIQKVLLGEKADYEQNPLFWSSEIPATMIQNVLMVKNHIKTLILYPENGLPPYYFSRDYSALNFDLEGVSQTEFYRKVCDAKGDFLWMQMDMGEDGIFLNNKSEKMVAGKLIMNLSQSQKIGIVAIGMDLEPFEEICSMGRLSPKECMVVTDSEGRVLVSSGEIPENVLEQTKQCSYHTGDFLKLDGYRIFNSQSDEDGLNIYYISPDEIWNEKLWKIIYAPIVLVLVLLVCSWPLSKFLSGLIAKPLAGLCSSMEKFSKGDFSQRAEVTSQDEIGHMAVSFNKMVEEMQRLIDQNYISEIRRQESELIALQAQINPHFLYNVLDSLYWQAVGSDNDEMSREILALSNLFRLILNKGNEEIAIRDEFEMIRSYLEIQKIRLGTRLEYELYVEPEIQNYKISKLLIQPFVENAVVHGIENSDRNGFVNVRASKKGNNLLFTIEDNGVGMDREQVEQILRGERCTKEEDEASHYAIINIQERLALNYKGKSKLEITSQKNLKTFVRLVLPYTKEGEKNGDAVYTV